jgi:hypothetical protein
MLKRTVRAISGICGAELHNIYAKFVCMVNGLDDERAADLSWNRVTDCDSVQWTRRRMSRSEVQCLFYGQLPDCEVLGRFKARYKCTKLPRVLVC